MNIEQLLQKFYDGVSTPEEECVLTEYFLNEENVDESRKEDQQLFRLLHDSQIQIPTSVSERVEKSILQMEVSSQKFLPHKRRWYYWISGAAAVALLCIGLFFAIREPSSPPKMVDTFKNPEEAALVAEQTLAFMSVQLNKGLNRVTDAGQKFEKVNQILDKHLK